MAARYCTQAFHFHNSVTGHEEFVDLGALRDSTTQAVVQYPAMFAAVQMDVPALSPGRKEFLKVHPGGPGE